MKRTVPHAPNPNNPEEMTIEQVRADVARVEAMIEAVKAAIGAPDESAGRSKRPTSPAPARRIDDALTQLATPEALMPWLAPPMTPDERARARAKAPSRAQRAAIVSMLAFFEAMDDRAFDAMSAAALQQNGATLTRESLAKIRDTLERAELLQHLSARAMELQKLIKSQLETLPKPGRTKRRATKGR